MTVGQVWHIMSERDAHFIHKSADGNLVVRAKKVKSVDWKKLLENWIDMRWTLHINSNYVYHSRVGYPVIPFSKHHVSYDMSTDVQCTEYNIFKYNVEEAGILYSAA